MFDYVNIIIHTIIALAIAIPSGKLHELLHVYSAKRMGYKINKIEWWKNEQAVSEGNKG